MEIKENGLTYYIEPVENNPRGSNGDTTSHFMYRIISEETDKIIGCITICWRGTARAVIRELPFKTDQEEEKIYLALIPYLPIFIDDIKRLYNTCFRYEFNTAIERKHADNNGYSIKISNGFYKTTQRIIFRGTPTDDQVRRQILTILHKYWKDDPETYMLKSDLNLFVPIEEKSFVRNLYFLRSEEFIEGITDSGVTQHADIAAIKIKNQGIKYIEDSSEFSIKVPSQFIYQQIMGNQINASTEGNNSPIIIDSHNISIAFGEIKAEIENKFSIDKQEIVFLLDQLNNELNTGKDPEKVKSIFDQLKQKAAWVNEKIISHPVLAQILAQLFAKYLGIA